MKDNNVLFFDCFGLFAEDPFTTYFKRHYGENTIPLKEHFCNGCDLGDISFKQLLANMERELSVKQDEVVQEIVEIGKLNMEMVDLALRCKERHTVCLLSNCMEEMMKVLFGGTIFDSCFDKQYRSYEIGLIKPNIKIYELAAKEMKIEKGHAFFFDDNPKNLPNAAKAGIEGILFKDAKSCEEELIRRGLL